MRTVQKTLRIPHDIVNSIKDMADAFDRDFSTVVNELLAESVKIRRCPGILFADGPSSRRAILAGTGLDVWEIIATYKSLDRDVVRLRGAYHWLGEAQLRAVLGFYAAYPDEIERRIARNDAWTKEKLARQHPSLNPDWS